MQITLTMVCLLLSACAGRPGNINDACDLLLSNRSWYKDLDKARHTWQVPASTILAFIHQESRFRARARPPRKRLFGLIPTVRPSSAYGYPQALDSTWRDYRHAVNRIFAERDDFGDATDFIGWYINDSRLSLSLPVEDIKGHYLAYHEGRGGYSRGTYKQKSWLLNVAEKVQLRAASYAAQLTECSSQLNRRSFFGF